MNRIRARWWMDARWQDKLTGSSVYRQGAVVGGPLSRSGQIQDGGGPPFWKKENRNNSAAIWDIITKFGTVVDMDSPQRAVTSFWPVTKSKMAAGPHLKKKLSKTQPLFQISLPNLVCWWPGTARNVPWCHFSATTKSKTKSKMAPAASLENFE